MGVHLTYDRALLADEDSVADAEVLDEIGALIRVEVDLEVLPAVLLGRLFVLVRDHEVIDHFFLRRSES